MNLICEIGNQKFRRNQCYFLDGEDFIKSYDKIESDGIVVVKSATGEVEMFKIKLIHHSHLGYLYETIFIKHLRDQKINEIIGE